MGDLTVIWPFKYIYENFYFEDFTDNSRAGGLDLFIETPKGQLLIDNMVFQNMTCETGGLIASVGPPFMAIKNVRFFNSITKPYSKKYYFQIFDFSAVHLENIEFQNL